MDRAAIEQIVAPFGDIRDVSLAMEAEVTIQDPGVLTPSSYEDGFGLV
jgi:hypothetical protein